MVTLVYRASCQSPCVEGNLLGCDCEDLNSGGGYRLECDRLEVIPRIPTITDRVTELRMFRSGLQFTVIDRKTLQNARELEVSESSQIKMR